MYLRIDSKHYLFSQSYCSLFQFVSEDTPLKKMLAWLSLIPHLSQSAIIESPSLYTAQTKGRKTGIPAGLFYALYNSFSASLRKHSTQDRKEYRRQSNDCRTAYFKPYSHTIINHAAEGVFGKYKDDTSAYCLKKYDQKMLSVSFIHG